MFNWSKNKLGIIISAIVFILIVIGGVWLINSQTKITTVKSEVQNQAPIPVVKDGITFNYIQSKKSLEYSGAVLAPNGCVYLKTTSLKSTNDKIILSIDLSSKGTVCTQQIVSIPISGNLGIDLNQETLKNLSSKIEVVKTSSDSTVKPVPTSKVN